MVSSTPRPNFTPGKDPVPTLQEVGWATGPVWTCGKSLPHRDSIPDRPARSSVAIPTELPGPLKRTVIFKIKDKILRTKLNYLIRFREFAHNSHLSVCVFYRKPISSAIEDNLTIFKHRKIIILTTGKMLLNVGSHQSLIHNECCVVPSL